MVKDILIGLNEAIIAGDAIILNERSYYEYFIYVGVVRKLYDTHSNNQQSSHYIISLDPSQH